MGLSSAHQATVLTVMVETHAFRRGRSMAPVLQLPPLPCVWTPLHFPPAGQGPSFLLLLQAGQPSTEVGTEASTLRVSEVRSRQAIACWGSWLGLTCLTGRTPSQGTAPAPAHAHAPPGRRHRGTGAQVWLHGKGVSRLLQGVPSWALTDSPESSGTSRGPHRIHPGVRAVCTVKVFC